MFFVLPPELIKVISSEMDIKDVKSLRLSCKASNDILTDQVLHSITIKISKSTVDKDIHKLQCLATRPCASATSHATHELTIKSLFPGYDYNGGSIVGGDDDSFDFELYNLDKEPQPAPEALLAEDEMKKFLFDALSSFQNVQRVSWQPVVADRIWLQATVMDALRALPKMNSLHVGITYCRLPVPFHWFSKLQEISIDGTNGQYHTGTLENLSKMVSHSPQLHSINMKSVIRYRIPIAKTQSLHQLFQDCSKDTPPLRLRRLVLDTCLLRFDDITLPHLRYLTSLSLTHIKDTSDPSPTYSDGVNPDSEEIKTEQKRWGSSLQEIWSALIKTDICLEEITVDVVVPAFVAYLASYSGLRMLSLTGGGSDQKASDDLATQFYAKPLANHVQSLKKLDIPATFEGLWCVDKHNLSLISQCLNLKHLEVSIISSPVDLDPIAGSSSAGLDVIRRIIDMVATSMPQLDTLSIRPAAPEYERFAPCSNGTMEHFVYTDRKITTTIATYQAPASCKRLPLLSVGSKQFLECQESIVNDGRLRYMPSPDNPLDSDSDYENENEDSDDDFDYDSYSEIDFV